MKLSKGETDVSTSILYALHESAIQTLRKTMNHATCTSSVYMKNISKTVRHTKKEDMETWKHGRDIVEICASENLFCKYIKENEANIFP